MTDKKRSPGHPPLYDEKMRQTAVLLPPYQKAWLEAQPESQSAVVRRLIDKAMQEQADAKAQVKSLLEQAGY
jgi:hypothetical protein